MTLASLASLASLVMLVMLVVGCGGGRAAAPAPTTGGTGTTATVTVTATNGSPPAPLTECMGRWNGAGAQSSGESWPVETTVHPIDASGACGLIEYPSLGCGGYVVGCSVLPDGRVWMQEVYTHNPGTCAPAGEIIAVCGGGRMSWSWTGSGDYASGTLARY